MTEVISLRISLDKLAELDRKAANSGLDRSKYLSRLIEEDLASPPLRIKRRRFASSRLLGKFNSKGSSNAQVRAALKASGEKNR